MTIQNPDGGWGGAKGTPSSIEETALAVEALAMSAGRNDLAVEIANAAISHGVAWLFSQTKRGTDFVPTPIGFYLAKLWYFERDYALLFAVGGLGRAAIQLSASIGQNRSL